MRLTTRTDAGVVISDAAQAFDKLAAFEDVCDDLARQAETIPAELAQLRTQGKQKTVHYRELFAQKLMNEQVVDLFRRHGISVERQTPGAGE